MGHGTTRVGGRKKMVCSEDAKGDLDADYLVFSTAIERRIEGAGRDDNGNIWEPREVIQLPFPCHDSLFDKYGNKITSCHPFTLFYHFHNMRISEVS